MGAVAALTACGSSSGSSLQTPIVGASVLVNHDRAVTRQLDVPTLFQDTKDASTLYLFGDELEAGDCRLYVSNDHGYTWTGVKAPSLPPYTDCGAESGHSVNFRTTFAEGSDGTLFLAYAAYDVSTGTGSRSALLGRSTDKGHTWSTVAVDAAPPVTSQGVREIDFEPHVAVDPANSKNVTVIWRRSVPSVKGVTTPPTRPYIATSTDGGATFTTPTMLFNRTMGFDPPYPVIVNGTLYVSWHETFPKGSDGKTPPDKIWFSSSTDGGKTFTDNQVASGTSVDTPVLRYDSTRSKFDMFWDMNNSSGNLDVYFASSSDGKSWGSPVRMNDDPENDKRDQELPEPSITPSGRIDVAFYDYRNDPFPAPKPGDLGARQDVYVASSFDGGSTWTANVRANDLQIDRTEGVWNNQFFLQVPPTLASGDTWAAAAWSDTRLGDASTSTQDLFVAPLAFDTSTIPAGLAGAVSSGGYDKSDLVVVGLLAGGAALFGGAGIALLVVMLATRRRRAGAQ
ncbi:MAG TPA: sialidase family protein [Candidatus Dormibacteraeota bacterium]|nr:sialidase family protein [Candidatus Dormibacteraeota bacterium]